MDQTLLNEIKETLQKEQAELQQQLDKISTPDVGDHVPGERAAKFPDYGDDAIGDNSESPSEVSEYSVNLDVTHSLEERLNEVAAALERVVQNKYGVCTKCGEEINADRLRANPAAETCMDCASK